MNKNMTNYINADLLSEKLDNLIQMKMNEGKSIPELFLVKLWIEHDSKVDVVPKEQFEQVVVAFSKLILKLDELN